MKIYCEQNLNEIKKLLFQMTNEQYAHNARLLSGSTIGEHVRHILEFYQSVLNSLETKIINYDNRERNRLIEIDKEIAIQNIDYICSELKGIIGDEPLMLVGDFSNSKEGKSQIKTTLFRELAYCLEHSIHHQALIKVGLLELNSLSFIDDTFGLAPATIRYKGLCSR
jgi:uncharacterized damage-inducible protein DinB